MRMHIGQRVKHAERPTGDHHGSCGDASDQLRDILAAPDRLVPAVGDFRFSLAARVECDDVVDVREGLDLRRPDPGRHGPARHEDDGMRCLRRASFQVVQPHPIAAREAAAAHDRGIGGGRGGRTHQQSKQGGQCSMRPAGRAVQPTRDSNSPGRHRIRYPSSSVTVPSSRHTRSCLFTLSRDAATNVLRSRCDSFMSIRVPVGVERP